MLIRDGMELTEKEIINMNWDRNVWSLCNMFVHTYISPSKEWTITFYWGEEKATVERLDD